MQCFWKVVATGTAFLGCYPLNRTGRKAWANNLLTHSALEFRGQDPIQLPRLAFDQSSGILILRDIGMIVHQGGITRIRKEILNATGRVL